MNHLPINLEDLKPERVSFRLSSVDTDLHLKPFSLASQIWAKRKFGSTEEINLIFQLPDWEKIVEILFYQLEEKTEIKTPEELSEKILGVKDQLEILNAITRCIGISQNLANSLYESQIKGKTEPPKNRAQRRKK